LYKPKSSSFDNYIKEKEIIHELYFELEDDQIEEGIALCNKISSKFYEPHKYLILADYYIQLGKNNKAILNYGKSFETGFSISNIDSLFYDKYKERLDKLYKKGNKIYKSSRDTSIINILYEIHERDQKIRGYSYENVTRKSYKDSMRTVDIHNLNIIDSLISVHGWVGTNFRGSGYDYNGKQYNPVISIIHQNELVTEKYLKLLYDACIEQKEDWIMSSRIMQNQLFRFINKNGYEFVKLRHLKFDKTLQLKNNNWNTFCLFNLAEFYGSYEKIYIYPTELWEERSHIQSINFIKSKLIEYGMQPQSIIISDEIMPMDSNEEIDNNYYFVFKY
jgi:hypothetical protein